MKKNRNFNLIGSYDEMGNAFYIFCPPFNHKNPPQNINKTETIQFKDVYLTLDWVGNKLAGIEISDAKENLDILPPENKNNGGNIEKSIDTSIPSNLGII